MVVSEVVSGCGMVLVVVCCCGCFAFLYRVGYGLCDCRCEVVGVLFGSKCGCRCFFVCASRISVTVVVVVCAFVHVIARGAVTLKTVLACTIVGVKVLCAGSFSGTVVLAFVCAFVVRVTVVAIGDIMVLPVMARVGKQTG